MHWIKVSTNHYINTDDIRDLMFIKKNDTTFYYRIFFTNGQSHDSIKFTNEEECRKHATEIFGLPQEAAKTFGLPKEEKAKPVKK